MMCCGVMSCDMMLYDVISCDMMWCNVMSCDMMPCDVMSCDVMLGNVMWYMYMCHVHTDAHECLCIYTDTTFKSHSTACHLPHYFLRQGCSLTRKLGWCPASPSDPLMSNPTELGLQACAWPFSHFYMSVVIWSQYYAFHNKYSCPLWYFSSL